MNFLFFRKRERICESRNYNKSKNVFIRKSKSILKSIKSLRSLLREVEKINKKIIDSIEKLLFILILLLFLSLFVELDSILSIWSGKNAKKVNKTQ